jgi:cytoskeletal protein CcmA (bactofilin family)
MSDDATRDRKVTTVEAESEFKGTLTSKCSVLVHGTVDGQINTPELTVTDTGLVVGHVTARELRSSGVLQGHLTAETMYISGTVRDNTVIRARSLEVNPARLTDPPQVVFGDCVLEVGDEPAVEAREPRDQAAERPASARTPSAAGEVKESAPEPPVTVPA